MIYTTEHIIQALKLAREARGLSQRQLSAKTGVSQAHISKIESGAVDLRVSNLVRLARVLDLELALVPRKSVAAVQSIVRAGSKGAADDGARRRVLKELIELQDGVAELVRRHPRVTEFAQLQRHLRDLPRFADSAPWREAVRATATTVEMFQENAGSMNALRDSLAQIDRQRNALAQVRHADTLVDDGGRRLKELAEIQDGVAELVRRHPRVTEFAQLQRHLRDLARSADSAPWREAMRATAATVKMLEGNAESINALRDSLAQIARHRNALAHGIQERPEAVRPAYSLDDDDGS